MQPKTEDNECLEEYLLKCASKDEFVSRDVLDCRLQSLIRNLPTSNHSQHLHHFTSSSSTIGTMIPTPRVPLSASLNLPITHSVEKSVIAACDYSAQQPNTLCTGNLLPNGNTLNAGVYGFLSNGYQQSPAHVSIDSGGTEGVPSVVVQSGSSQMIFTPKFSDTRSLTNSEPSNSDGQSTTVTQLQGGEYISGQNNCLLPYFGVRAGIGTRSNLQQNPSSHNFQRDAANGGLDFMGNKKQLVHETPVSDNYLTAIPNGNSSEHLHQHQHFDQKRLTPGDGSEKNGTDLVGNGSLYGIASFTGSTINNPDMDYFSIHSKLKTNSLIASEPNLQAVKQKTHIKPDILDSSSKINMRASRFSQQLKFQHQPLQIGSLSEHNTESVQHLAEQQTDHCPHLAGNEGLQSSEFQNQFQQMTDAGDGSNVVQMICQPFGVGQDISVSVNSQHMHTLEQDPDSQSKFTDLSAREATESLLQKQWHPNSLEKPHTLYQSSREQPALNLSQRIRGHDEAWRSSLSSEGSITVYPAASRRASVPQQEIYNSQRWLLFLMHARRCMFPEGKCHSVDCIKVQRLLKHMKACNLEQCPYPSCSNTKKLMKHHKLCKSQDCQICVPVHRYLLRRAHCRTSDGGLLNSKKGSGKHFDARGGAGLLSETIQSTGKTSEDRQSTVKRMKTESSSSYSQIKVEKSPASVLAMSLPQSSQDAQKQVCPEVVKVDADVMMAEPPLRSGAGSLHSCENKADKGVDSHCMKHEVEPYLPPDVEPYIPHDVEPYIPTEHADPVKQDGMEIEQEINQAKVDIKQECAVLHSEHAAVMNLGKTKEQGVSLTEVFNPEQVGEHTNGPVKQVGIYIEQGTNQANSQIQLESTVHSEQAATMNLAKPKVQVASLTDLFNPKHVREHVAGLVKKEGIDIVQGTDQSKLQDHPATTKLAKPKVQGVSLTEVFTPEQVKEHITGLRQWIGQSKAKAEKKQAMEHSMSENSCQLCAVEKLTFEPPPMYCMNCAARIKRNTMYYTMVAGESRYYFCISCYNDTRGHNIEVYGTAMLKASMEKKKNDEEIEESWVQCDKCETWQHQICALFNGRRNDGGQAEYTCPYCYIGEIERGERKPLPQSSVLGAKDLPRTILSDHIEQRLFRRLKQERRERARVLGKHIDEVPGAESLVVRVVSSVDKKLEVKQQFLEIFQEQNYPTEFPYKSKVILLFQKIEGVEVCLFGMYVQEFGSECQFPNQRRVYLSYLDSVKYFRPEIKTISGEALRTFVYHEILVSRDSLSEVQIKIGYLEYCKRRGFVSCYIWACPPVKGEDYILYCHPEIQKTPKSDKLREWYLSMLRKAAKENIVVDLTNLYDHFFVSTGECKAKVTAARLPYFNGDYWPGAAEDFMNQLSREEDDKKQQKKGKLKKIITKRSLKAAGHTDISDNNSKDIRLMHKLSTSICPMKEDFIMVHLQHSCTHCCNLMVSGNRWVCNQCKNFQLCDKCHDAEDRLCERDRHPIRARDTHVLHPVEVRDVPADTKDRDEILESEFFDTRQAFLSLCQGNHYQYDTLRRAKHSSMMVLYHLHNPTAPAFVTTCNVCHNDIEAGQGWRCEICTDYDVCDVCFKKDGSVDHPHKLTNHPSIADCYAQNKEARQKRVLQLRKTLDLLVHASQCRSQHCSYTNCRRVKALFRHGMQCKIRASKGCGLCKKMWYILKLHARACKERECHVPRCRDLKEHSRRLQQQSDSRRRAAVMEMVRQRAEEVADRTYICLHGREVDRRRERKERCEIEGRCS